MIDPNLYAQRVDEVERLVRDNAALKAELDRTTLAWASAADERDRLREYVKASEFWKLEPADQKERAAWIAHRLSAQGGPQK